MPGPSPVVALDGICKAFGPLLANDHVCFDLLPCEIHGLLGENGAGKTTLMNILYGLHRPDAGRIVLWGEEKRVESPRMAIALGIGMVHQHFLQIPTLSVLDNVVLGLPNPHEPWMDRRGARRRLAETAKTYGLQVDPEAHIWQLSIGDRQRVEILKALYRQARVLILDEPTSVLTPQEARELFAALRLFVQKGLSVIFITHNLEEAIATTDRVTVMRDGRAVATLPTTATSKAELARLMVGREVLFRLQQRTDREVAGEPVLRVERLSVMGDRGTLAVRDVSFEVRSGEIVGVAGVDGNGQSELVHALTGLRPCAAGRFWIGTAEGTHASPRAILAQGAGHIPGDLDEALIGELTVAENLALDVHYTPVLSRRGIVDREQMRRRARELIRRYDIRVPSEDTKVKALSGGNKQKVVVARELARQPKLLIAAHPTRGVDIGAEEHIRNLLLEGRKAGMAILLVSTKLDEILSLSDRILVIEKGRIMGEMQRQEADVDKIGLLMAGSEG